MNDTVDALAPARILVVDDQRVHRVKLVRAVRALGHDAETVDSGAQALLRLQDASFDLVLLDILMPDMSGFEVMDVMRRDRRIAGTPVIVVSALESEMTSVVRAVEMGAVDVLPKRFDAVLLAARLDSVLERRSARLRESENRRHMNRLIDAAAMLEQHAVPPAGLGLGQTCARDDAIGRLARVFVQMIDEAQSQDARLQHQLDALRIVALALVTGLLLGLALPLAHTAASTLDNRFAGVFTLGLWLAVLIALPCLGVTLWGTGGRKRLGELLLPATRLALTAGLLGVLPLLWLLRELPVVTLATVLPAEIVFALLIRAIARRQVPGAADLAALTLGCVAVVLLFLWPGATTLGWRTQTLGLALCAPLGWALATNDLRRARSASITIGDAVALTGLVAGISAMACLPVALLDESRLSVVAPGLSLGMLATALLAIVLGVAAVLRILLVRQAGTVSAGASSLAAGLCAIAIAVLALGEVPPPEASVPLALFAAMLAVRGIASDTRRRAIVQTLDVHPAS